MYSNNRKYLPDSYGSNMVLHYIEKLTTERVKDKGFSFQFEKHIAESEESFLGLGILPNNKKEWYQQVSTSPKIYTNNTPGDTFFSVSFVLMKDV